MEINFESTVPSVPNLFPLAYGNEEESGLLDNVTGELAEPRELATHLRTYVPVELQSTNIGPALFLKNASKIYDGGTADDACGYIDHGSNTSSSISGNIERATAECATPLELSSAIRASELLLIKTIENYARIISDDSGQSISVRSQRRVVDSAGSRKACHDNYGLDPKTSFLRKDDLPEVILGHLAARSFVTGAGYVSSRGLRFAQKIDGLFEVVGRGYHGTMVRCEGNGLSPRLEIRCGDINLSDWAVRMRVGSAALAIAIAQTPLAAKFSGTNVSNAITESKKLNRLLLASDGTIQALPAHAQALDFEQRLAETVLVKLPNYVEQVPDELRWTAEELLEYCQDFKKVIAGEAPVSLLADRADWAAKFEVILRSIDRDRAAGIKRTIKDIHSQAQDLRYDYRLVSATDGKLNKMQVGWGYKLRDAGKFRVAPKNDTAIQRLYYKAPPETRAALRAYLLRTYDVTNCSWNQLTIANGGSSDIVIQLDDVRQTYLNAADRWNLSQFLPGF